jgi:ribonuclease HI
MNILSCDGASRGSGICAWAFVVFIDNERIVLCGNIEHGKTNNYMEYTALIEGLKWCVKNDVHDVTVIQDSQLVSRQMTGEYVVRDPVLILLNKRARMLADLVRVVFMWDKRNNKYVKLCDAHCNYLMDKSVNYMDR